MSINDILHVIVPDVGYLCASCGVSSKKRARFMGFLLACCCEDIERSAEGTILQKYEGKKKERARKLIFGGYTFSKYIYVYICRIYLGLSKTW